MNILEIFIKHFYILSILNESELYFYLLKIDLLKRDFFFCKINRFSVHFTNIF